MLVQSTAKTGWVLFVVLGGLLLLLDRRVFVRSYLRFLLPVTIVAMLIPTPQFDRDAPALRGSEKIAQILRRLEPCRQDDVRHRSRADQHDGPRAYGGSTRGSASARARMTTTCSPASTRNSLEEQARRERPDQCQERKHLGRIPGRKRRAVHAGFCVRRCAGRYGSDAGRSPIGCTSARGLRWSSTSASAASFRRPGCSRWSTPFSASTSTRAN